MRFKFEETLKPLHMVVHLCGNCIKCAVKVLSGAFYYFMIFIQQYC